MKMKEQADEPDTLIEENTQLHSQEGKALHN